jgi:hypothetical protein
VKHVPKKYPPFTTYFDQQRQQFTRKTPEAPGKLMGGGVYRETFSRLDERPFEVLYADGPSRPNVPVNVLVGLESLKADFGWSDAELYDLFSYDVQVRYALGYQQLSEGDFDLRSLYYFRERVSRYMQEK